MRMLRRSLIILILTISNISFADCRSDCKIALDAADKVIANLKEEISIHKQYEEKQEAVIIDLTVSLNEKNQALEAWYRNPFVVGALGLVVGAGTIIYLRR